MKQSFEVAVTTMSTYIPKKDINSILYIVLISSFKLRCVSSKLHTFKSTVVYFQVFKDLCTASGP